MFVWIGCCCFAVIVCCFAALECVCLRFVLCWFRMVAGSLVMVVVLGWLIADV